MAAPAFFLALVIAIIITEFVWAYSKSTPKLAMYAWITAGGCWAALVAQQQILMPGFQWQEVVWPFFSVILFMILFEGYKKVRGRK
ncbi:MAG TPA: hypothetical protein VFH43_01440 [Candidatus Kapabacteria bacterium]|nr:hypothetical protein [Candidatus Kapabacteria bacterium]